MKKFSFCKVSLLTMPLILVACDNNEGAMKPNVSYVGGKLSVQNTQLLSKNDGCLYGIADIVGISNEVSYATVDNPVKLQYKCKISNRLVNIPENDAVTVTPDLVYSQRISDKINKSVTNASNVVSVVYDSLESTYVVHTKPTKLKMYDVHNVITANSNKYTFGSNLDIGVFKDGYPALTAIAGINVVSPGLNGKYNAMYDAGFVFDLTNVVAAYRGGVVPYSIKYDSGAEAFSPSNLQISMLTSNPKCNDLLKNEFDGKYLKVYVDPNSDFQNECNNRDIAFADTLITLTFNDQNELSYTFPVKFDFSPVADPVKDVVIDVADEDQGDIYLPAITSYKYYFNFKSLLNDDSSFSFSDKDIRVINVKGSTIQSLSVVSSDASVVEVKQDENHNYYLQANADGDATLNFKITWYNKYLNSTKEFSHEIPVHVSNSMAFDNVKFSYYNYLGNEIDPHSDIDPDGPAILWKQGYPLKVKATGYFENDSRKIDITGIFDWSVQNESGLSVDTHTQMSYDKIRNQYVLLPVSAGKDDVNIKVDDGILFDFYASVLNMVPQYISSVKINDTVVNHFDINSKSQFPLTFDMLLKGGVDSKTGESSILCHGASLNDCGGVSLFVGDKDSKDISGAAILNSGNDINPGVYKFYLQDNGRKGLTSSGNPVSVSADYNQDYYLSGDNDEIGRNDYSQPDVVVMMPYGFYQSGDSIGSADSALFENGLGCDSTNKFGNSSCTNPLWMYFGYDGIGGDNVNDGVARTCSKSDTNLTNYANNWRQYVNPLEFSLNSELDMTYIRCGTNDENTVADYVRHGTGISYLWYAFEPTVGISFKPTTRPLDLFIGQNNATAIYAKNSGISIYSRAYNYQSATGRAQGFAISIKRKGGKLYCKDITDYSKDYSEGSCQLIDLNVHDGYIIYAKAELSMSSTIFNNLSTQNSFIKVDIKNVSKKEVR